MRITYTPSFEKIVAGAAQQKSNRSLLILLILFKGRQNYIKAEMLSNSLTFPDWERVHLHMPTMPERINLGFRSSDVTSETWARAS